MKNIFVIPDLYSLSVEKKVDESYFGSILYRSIPLCYEFLDSGDPRRPDAGDSYFNFGDKLKKILLEKLEKNKSAYSIAEMAIALCSPYLKYESKQINNEIHHLDWETRLDLIEEYDKERKNILNLFYESIYKESYKEELIHFIILSYHYNKSLMKLKKGEEVQRVYGEKKKTASSVSDKLVKFYKTERKNKSIILSPFINRSESNNIDFYSHYDIEILLGLIESTNEAYNPFLHLSNFEYSEVNINKFLSLFKNMHLNKKDEIKNDFYSEEIFIYNQYLLERITNLNFINLLYELQNKYKEYNKDLNSLYQIAASPLLNFRLDFLNAIYSILGKIRSSKIIYIDGYKRIIYHESREILKHQLACVLPILNFTFYYLISLSQKEGIEVDSLFKQYFNEPNLKEKLSFFTSGMDCTPLPAKKPLPSNTKDKNYQKLIIEVYRSFIYKTTTAIINENIFSRLNLIESDQRKWLQDKLNDPFFTPLQLVPAKDQFESSTEIVYRFYQLNDFYGNDKFYCYSSKENNHYVEIKPESGENIFNLVKRIHIKSNSKIIIIHVKSFCHSVIFKDELGILDEFKKMDIELEDYIVIEKDHYNSLKDTGWYCISK